MYIAVLDKCLKERGIGEIKLRKDRVWALAYTDDRPGNISEKQEGDDRYDGNTKRISKRKETKVKYREIKDDF